MHWQSRYKALTKEKEEQLFFRAQWGGIWTLTWIWKYFQIFWKTVFLHELFYWFWSMILWHQYLWSFQTAVTDQYPEQSEGNLSYKLDLTECRSVNIPGKSGLGVSILHCPLFFQQLSHDLIHRAKNSNLIFWCFRTHLTTPTTILYPAPILCLRTISFSVISILWGWSNKQVVSNFYFKCFFFIQLVVLCKQCCESSFIMCLKTS